MCRTYRLHFRGLCNDTCYFNHVKKLIIIIIYCYLFATVHFPRRVTHHNVVGLSLRVAEFIERILQVSTGKYGLV